MGRHRDISERIWTGNPALAREVERHFNQIGLIIQHNIVNGVAACDWTQHTRDCVVCHWHDLDIVAPL